MSVKEAIQHSVNVARNIQHNVDKPRQKKTTSQQGKWFVQANRLKGLVHMDKACDVTCLQNKRKCKQRFAFTVAMTSREYTLFAIFTLPKIHLVYSQILHNHFFQFLLGLKVVPREIEFNG